MKLRELLQQMKDIQQKIEVPEIFICGGVARQKMAGSLDVISDLDITNGNKNIQYLATEFGSELSKKYNITRRSHDDGHISIYIGSFKMDFSSNFNAPNIINLLKQIGINNPTELEKEMYSRDYTCNALLLSLDLKKLTDPTHKGFADMKNKIIRTCLDPAITLTTNKNRVVRAIYLASKLDFDIDPAIIEFVKKHPQSIKISTTKAMSEKLNEAFSRNADRAVYYIEKMGLWNEIPITEIIRPYYLKSINPTQKKAYFQGGGGVNEPSPKKKKYKSDPAIINQIRIKEPFYKNYDIYETSGEHSPGAGLYQNMGKYKDVKDFINKKRKRNQHKYKSDDSWKQDDGTITKARINLLNDLIKVATDFPLDEYSSPEVYEGDANPVGRANLTGGYMDKYLPPNDFDDKPPTNLDYGRDYIENETASNIDILIEKYLQPETNNLYGLPDGVNLPDEDLGYPNEINPEYGTRGPESLIYEDKWNI